ncbi:MAG: CPBP family intramembrane glutamic endopeptidase [Candidatus Eisenbacteria bacterium]
MDSMTQTEMVGRPRRLYQRPALAIAVLLILYVLTEAISESLARSIIGNSEGAGVFVKLGFFSLLVFLVVPRLLKLPRGDISFSQYFQVVGLTTGVPLGRILILALSCYVIFAASQLIGSLIYYSTHPGGYALDISRHSLLSTRSIIAGIFEEIVMRGVIVTLLLGVFSRLKAVVVSAAIFAGLHLLNMLNPESSTVWVLAQAMWAFGLGVMYAYLFITTRTILPLILIHYLLNGTVSIWFRGLDGQDLTSALFGIPFFGLLPAGIAILWGRYLWRRYETVS